MAPRAPHVPCMHHLLPGPSTGVRLEDGGPAAALPRTCYQPCHFSHSGPNQQKVPMFSLHGPLPSFRRRGAGGVLDGSRVAFSFSVKKAQTIQSQEGRALLPRLATGRIPGELRQRHRGSRERENSQACGASEQEGDLSFVNDSTNTPTTSMGTSPSHPPPGHKEP